MAVNSRFISNNEATPVVETDIFRDREDDKFALVTLGKGMRRDDPLFDGYLKLRSNVYVHQTGMLEPDVVNEDGTETDNDDERSSHFLVIENRLGSVAAVACLRLIEKSNEHPAALPIEALFPEAFSQTDVQNGSVEASRFISCIDNKHEQIIAIGELFKSGLARIDRLKLGPTYGVVEKELEQSLGFLGAVPRRIAEPKYLEEYNDFNLGIEIDTDEMVRKIGKGTLASLPLDDSSVRFWGKTDYPENTGKLKKTA